MDNRGNSGPNGNPWAKSTAELADALGAETVGNVSGTFWECYECGDSDTCRSGYEALVAMNHHRKVAHDG